MRSSLTRILFLVLLLGTLGPGRVFAEVAIPPLTGRIVDQVGLLSPSDKAQVESVLRSLEMEKGSQVVVLTLPSTSPETIEQYSIRVAEAWKLGRKGIDDGALLIVAHGDRTVRIEVGYGLEGALPDALANRIIEEQIIPHFQNAEFSAGIRDGVESINKVIRKEPLPESRRRKGTSENSLFSGIVFLFVLGPLLGQFLKSLFGPLLGSFLAGGLAFFISSFLLPVWASLLLGILAFFVVLVSDGRSGISPFGSRSYRGYGGGFGGGSSGGGFSGGGGSFGGGGASGRW